MKFVGWPVKEKTKQKVLFYDLQVGRQNVFFTWPPGSAIRPRALPKIPSLYLDLKFWQIPP